MDALAAHLVSAIEMATYMFGVYRLVHLCGMEHWNVLHNVCCCAADYGHPKDRKLSGDLLDLLDRIFVVDPEQRITLAGIQARDSATV